MIKKILIAISFLAFFNGYVVIRLLSRWLWAQEHSLIVFIIAAIFFILQLAGPFGEHFLFPKLKQKFGLNSAIAVVWVAYAALGILSCLFVYTFMLDVISIILRVFTLSASNAYFNQFALYALGIGTFCTMALGIWQASTGPIVLKVEIPLSNLPASFDGFTIAQISDLHVGSIIGRNYVENVVKIVNDLKPSLIAMTGDFIDGTVNDLREEIAPLAALKAPYGKFFVTGNHEYYWGAMPWIAAFTKLGVHVLCNEHVIIKHNGAEIIVAGITDYSTLNMRSSHASSPKNALEGAPLERTKILLAHQPASYQMAHEAGFDLQLSGHTHGGQYFPFNLLIRFFQRYYKGLNRYENMWIYVNKGTGYWGPPLRAGVPSEITLITLRAACLDKLHS